MSRKTHEQAVHVCVRVALDTVGNRSPVGLESAASLSSPLVLFSELLNVTRDFVLFKEKGKFCSFDRSLFYRFSLCPIKTKQRKVLKVVFLCVHVCVYALMDQAEIAWIGYIT